MEDIYGSIKGDIVKRTTGREVIIYDDNASPERVAPRYHLALILPNMVAVKNLKKFLEDVLEKD
jgi:hypothetical protein